MNGARSGSTSTSVMSALGHPGPGLRAANSSIEPSRIGSGRITSVAPHSHTASMAVASGRVVGPSRATWLAGVDAPGLEGGGHGLRVVEELPVGHDVLGAADGEGDAGAAERPAASSRRSGRVRAIRTPGRRAEPPGTRPGDGSGERQVDQRSA